MQQLKLMQNNGESRSATNRGEDAFETIDDLSRKAEELSLALKKLTQIKHPLDIRRGTRKGVSLQVRDDSNSKQMKAAGRTYFLDIETTREGKRYLRITESRKGAGDKWERNTINVFPEDAEEFAISITKMADRL